MSRLGTGQAPPGGSVSQSVRLTGLLVACLAVAFQGGLAYDSALRLADSGAQVVRPWTLDRFGRVIGVINPIVDTGGLNTGDRIVAINGLPLINRSVHSLVLDSAEPGDFLEVAVERAGHEGAGIETLLVHLSGVAGTNGAETIWLTAVVWPLACVGLAVYLLVSSAENRMSWLLAGVLIFFAQLGRVSSADVLVWPEPWRSSALFYQNLTMWPGLLWMLLLILFFPGRLWRPPVSRLVVWIAAPGVAALTAVQIVGALGEAFSYQAIRWLEPYGRTIHFSSMNLLLYTLTAFIMMTAFWSSRPLYGFNQLSAFRLLRTCLFVAFLPMALRVTLLADYVRPDYAPWSRWLGVALFIPTLLVPAALVYLHRYARVLPVRLAVRQWLLSRFEHKTAARDWIDRLFPGEARKDTALRECLETIPRIPPEELFQRTAKAIEETVSMRLFMVHWRKASVFRAAYLIEGAEAPANPDELDVPADDPGLTALHREAETGDWDFLPAWEDRKTDSTQQALADSIVAHPLGRNASLLGYMTLSTKTDGSVFNASDYERLKAIGDALADSLARKTPWNVT